MGWIKLARKTRFAWIKLVRISSADWIKLVRISPSRVDQAGENDWIMLVGNDTIELIGLARVASQQQASKKADDLVTANFDTLKPPAYCRRPRRRAAAYRLGDAVKALHFNLSRLHLPCCRPSYGPALSSGATLYRRWSNPRPTTWWRSSYALPDRQHHGLASSNLKWLYPFPPYAPAANRGEVRCAWGACSSPRWSAAGGYGVQRRSRRHEG